MPKRLTEKIDNEYIVSVSMGIGGYTDAAEEKQYEANRKLGELEDIEEELETTISILNKARKNGIWVRLLDYTKPTFIKISFRVCDVNFDKHLLDVRRIFLYPNSPHALIGDNIYYFKDYGTTWALTKEELEK